MSPIQLTSIPLPPLPTQPPQLHEAASSNTFKDLLLDSISQVNEMQVNADRAVESLFTGGDVNPSEVLTAVQKADLTFRLMMQVRNKLMQAYQEIRDIQI